MNYTREQLDNLPYILEMSKEGLRRFQCPEPDDKLQLKYASSSVCPNCRIFAEQFTQIQQSLEKYLQRKVALIMRTFQTRIAHMQEKVNAITTRYLRETISRRGDQQESLLEQTPHPQPFQLTGPKHRSLQNSIEQKHFGNRETQEPNTTSRTRIISPEQQSTDLDTLRKQIGELRSHLIYAHKEQEADVKLKQEHQTALENILKLKEENKRLKGDTNKYRSELESALLELGQIKSILMNLSRG